jgi:pyrroloquinoline quinone biosynthesis protein D
MDRTKVPQLPRGVRLHFDKLRDTWVLLAPERALMLDEIGHAILSNVDGQRSLGEIAEQLAAQYNAPVDQVEADSADLLTSLHARRFLDVVA